MIPTNRPPSPHYVPHIPLRPSSKHDRHSSHYHHLCLLIQSCPSPLTALILITVLALTHYYDYPPHDRISHIYFFCNVSDCLGSCFQRSSSVGYPHTPYLMFFTVTLIHSSPARHVVTRKPYDSDSIQRRSEL